MIITNLYIIGLIANCCFGIGFFIQWYTSIKRKESFIPKAFWQLYSIGSALMICHCLIQRQFLIMILQSINFIIYKRNLNLMKKQPSSFIQTLIIMLSFILIVSLVYTLIYQPSEQISWFSTPNILIKTSSPQWHWHLIGSIGLVIFSSRFIIQWIHIELKKRTEIPPVFWIIGLVSCFLCTVYFIRIGDPVNIIGYGSGIVPPIVNLKLIYFQKKCYGKK